MEARALSVQVNIVSLSIFAFLVVTEAVSFSSFTCHACSYQQPATADYECVDNPSQVKTARTVQCGTGRRCVIREVYSKISKTIESFLRQCELEPVAEGCDLAGDTRVCVLSCSGNFCNGQIGGHVQEAVVLKLKNKANNNSEDSGSGGQSWTNCLSSWRVLMPVLLYLINH